MITVDAVTKRYGDFAALNDVSLDVPAGCGFVILGRSGTGKSVLLRHIIGLVRPDSGSVFVQDQEVSSLTGRDLARVRKSACSMPTSTALASRTCLDCAASPSEKARRSKLSTAVA